ncbi:MAG: hypothetical protein ABL877_04615 [Thiobacillus sp.]
MPAGRIAAARSGDMPLDAVLTERQLYRFISRQTLSTNYVTNSDTRRRYATGREIGTSY